MLPNSITLLRFLLACVFCALLYDLFTGSRGFVPAIAVFLAICLTDLLDGRLVRRLGAVSYFGALLDVLADVFYIVSSLVVLAALRRAPVWFIAVVLAKFAEYIITSRLISSRIKSGSTTFVNDPLGRLAAAVYFLLPGAICAFYSIPGLDFNLAVDLTVYTAALITVLSSAARCRHCLKVFKRETA